MRITRLRVDGVRNLNAVDISPAAGVNVFYGENGAGKTSLLESLHVLATGRSFRGRKSPFVNRHGGVANIFAQISHRHGDIGLGFERARTGWRARSNGVGIASLSELAHQITVVVFHPGLHALVEGSPSVRRRFLDYGVFHVEPSFLDHWRGYARALKQRNAALKIGQDAAAWEAEMVRWSVGLSAARERYVDQLQAAFDSVLSLLSLSVVGIELGLRPGLVGAQLADRLASQRAQDRAAGYARNGPHRADLLFVDSDGTVAGRLSRGQQKLVSLAVILSQAKVLNEVLGESPIVALDDLASELDAVHLESSISMLRDLGAQMFVSGTSMLAGADRVFHVERGRIGLG